MSSRGRRTPPAETRTPRTQTTAADIAGRPIHRRQRFGRPARVLLVVGFLAVTTATSADTASGRRSTRSREPGADTAEVGRTTMDLEAKYSLRTRLSYAAARLDVVETVDVVNRAHTPVDALRFSVLARAFGEFRLRSVRVDGRPVRVRFTNAASMLVPLDRPLVPGDSLRLEISFVDHPSADVRDSLHARLSKAEGMLRAADWFPVLSDGHGLRDPGDSQFTAAATSITLDLVTDRRLVVAAPGRLLERRGRHHVYRLDGARDYAFVVAPHLHTVTTTTRDGVRVRVYYPAGVAGGAALRSARHALEVYDDAFGPYPWPELVVAPTPGGWLATESPALVFLGADRYARADVVRHEVAHEWFYALVGNDQLREPWLDEAFATFGERYLFGPSDRSYCSRRPVDSAVYAFPDTFERWDCGGYVETIYNKGAAMIDGVRRRMGERAFFATMRTFIADNRFGIVTGPDLVQAWLDGSRRPAAIVDHLERYLSRRTMASVVRMAARAGARAG